MDEVGVEGLFEDFERDLGCYFTRPAWSSLAASRTSRPDSPERWVRAYRKAITDGSLPRDEPWLTLVALYGIFGTLGECGRPDDDSVEVWNDLMAGCFPAGEALVLDSIDRISLEVRLPEATRFRRYLATQCFQGTASHPYSDRRSRLRSKLAAGTVRSLEGGTNVDALIEGSRCGTNVRVVLEAKFLSDIDSKVSYVPVRNQIARTIDAALELSCGASQEKPGDGSEVWFLLLTPELFRGGSFGRPKCGPMAGFQPERGRLYGYKMEDYLAPAGLRRDLPHWEGAGVDWEGLSRRIGWLTFEDIVGSAKVRERVPEARYAAWRRFFEDRELLPFEGG